MLMRIRQRAVGVRLDHGWRRPTPILPLRCQAAESCHGSRNPPRRCFTLRDHFQSGVKMEAERLAAQVGAARAYQSLFVPALFARWADLVAQAAKLSDGEQVLDVACGTGVLAAAAAERVGASGRVCGVDSNPGMLQVAAELHPQIDWRQADAAELPFDDASFDAVLCQFGLMFFPDQGRAIAEMRRVLKPGGRLVIAVWNALEYNPAYAMLVALLRREAGEPAAAALSAPFACGDRCALYGLVDDAGFSAVVCQSPAGQARFPSVRSVVEAELLGWLPLMGVELSEAASARLVDLASEEMKVFEQASGEAHFPLSAHLISARRD